MLVDIDQRGRRTMRAFLGEFDRVTLGVILAGIAIGAIWVALLDLGVVIAFIVLLIASIVLISRRRWIEIGLMLVAIGATAQLGYALFGAPAIPPPGTSGPEDLEIVAPGVAGLIMYGGIAMVLFVGAWDLWEGLRRERLDRAHRRRRRQMRES
jgi:hypothetical protein